MANMAYDLSVGTLTEDLPRFTLRVDLAQMPPSFWAEVSAGGGNVRCFAGSTELPREVVGCDTDAHTGDVWILTDLDAAGTLVQVRLIDGAVDYAPGDPYGRDAVWSDYTVVEHGYQQFDGMRGADGADTTGVDLGVGGPAGAAPRTMSIWAQPTDGAPRCMWGYGEFNIALLWEMARYDGGLIFHGYGDGLDTISVSAPAPVNNWTHCTLTYDGTTLRVYTGGQYAGARDMALDTVALPNTLGGGGFFSPWLGRLGEGRLLPVVRSDAWIAAEYANQFDPAGFFSITPVSSTPPTTTTQRRPRAAVSPAQHNIVTGEQIISLRTVNGVQLHQFLGSQLTTATWTRDLREVSRAEITVPATAEYLLLPDIVPWLHWVDVWDANGEELYWTGPIQKVECDWSKMVITARDSAALYARTRCPITKRWEAEDPAAIAAELWGYMIETHNLATKTIERNNPLGDRFDYRVVKDTKMLDAVFDDLVSKGLFWSVVSGIPILGPAPLKPIAALGEGDFIGAGITLIRDGAETYNDVLLRGADNIASVRVDRGGLNLQKIVDVDDMFGVSNAARAANQYVRYASKIRDAVSLPEGSVLHPNAPLVIGQLIPSMRVNVEAYGMLFTVELESVEVSLEAGKAEVSVKLESVNDEKPELILAESSSKADDNFDDAGVPA
jgi:hypothetical protein